MKYENYLPLKQFAIVLKSELFVLLAGLVITVALTIYSVFNFQALYSYDMTVEGKGVDKNVIVELTNDLNTSRDLKKAVENASFTGQVIDIKDKVLTEKTAPSRLARITLNTTQADIPLEGRDSLSEAIVQSFNHHGYIEKSGGEVLLVRPLGPAAQSNSRMIVGFKLLITGFLATIFVVFGLYYFKQFLKAWKEPS